MGRTRLVFDEREPLLRSWMFPHPGGPLDIEHGIYASGPTSYMPFGFVFIGRLRADAPQRRRSNIVHAVWICFLRRCYVGWLVGARGWAEMGRGPRACPVCLRSTVGHPTIPIPAGLHILFRRCLCGRWESECICSIPWGAILPSTMA